jgi:hypothetical protein
MHGCRAGVPYFADVLYPATSSTSLPIYMSSGGVASHRPYSVIYRSQLPYVAGLNRCASSLNGRVVGDALDMTGEFLLNGSLSVNRQLLPLSVCGVDQLQLCQCYAALISETLWQTPIYACRCLAAA